MLHIDNHYTYSPYCGRRTPFCCDGKPANKRNNRGQPPHTLYHKCSLIQCPIGCNLALWPSVLLSIMRYMLENPSNPVFGSICAEGLFQPLHCAFGLLRQYHHHPSLLPLVHPIFLLSLPVSISYYHQKTSNYYAISFVVDKAYHMVVMALPLKTI